MFSETKSTKKFNDETPHSKSSNTGHSLNSQQTMFQDLENAYDEVMQLQSTKESKLNTFAQKCTDLLEGQSNTIKKNSKNIIARFLYFIQNNITEVGVSPSKTKEKKLFNSIHEKGRKIILKYADLDNALKPIKTTNDTPHSHFSRLASHDDNQSQHSTSFTTDSRMVRFEDEHTIAGTPNLINNSNEDEHDDSLFVRSVENDFNDSEALNFDSKIQNVMQSNYNDFCKKVSFNICLVMLASSTLLIASTYGTLPVMTALIITSSTNLAANSAIQYYNHKKLSIITGNHTPILASGIISTLIILAGSALAITAMLYASQATLPVLAAALMVLTLYMAFEYTKLKGQTNISEDQIEPTSPYDNPANSQGLEKGNNLYTKFVSLFSNPNANQTDQKDLSYNLLTLEESDEYISSI
ncbi:MAG: hypothetical protein P8L77_03195 [Gammaproteobacteria bacterium]|nr:hypothetical protein [Gammaproteobacteria bacterium]